MQESQSTIVFDQRMASAYDERNAVWAAESEALCSLMRVVFAGLPANARILCVGAGTGSEILALVPAFPDWHFTAVEPSAPMLGVCRSRLEASGLSARCSIHEGFIDTLPAGEPFDAATCLLVSQFILRAEARRNSSLKLRGDCVPEHF
jgi:tRNA (cmo5U34)-methyltransferase